MGKISRFELFNTQVGQTIARIEMDEDLLAPEAKILDHRTMMMPNLRGGAIYTLVPMEDHTLAALSRVKDAYEGLRNREVPDFSSAISRMDAVVHSIAILFGEIEYTVVKSGKDIEQLIRPTNTDEPLEVVKYTVLGELTERLKEFRGEN